MERNRVAVLKKEVGRLYSKPV